jgi:uncharacterized protein
MIQLMLLMVTLAVPLPPAPDRYVTDRAGVIDDQREHELNERLAQLHREETAQILVYVDRKLPEGTTLEEMGAEAIRTWAPGTKEKDNGAILFLFVDDRLSRIETGYGLEGTLTDAESSRILTQVMRPLLQAGDHTGAVEAGAAAMIDRALGRPLPQRVIPARRQARAAEADNSDPGIMILVVFLTLGGVALIIVLAVRYSGSASITWSSSGSSWSSSGSSWSSSGSSWSSSGGSSSSGGGGSSGGSSSFRGGGGSGGGGGASGSW